MRIVKFLCCLLIIFCLFPYLRLLPLGLDAQPNALIVSIPIIISCRKIKIPLSIQILFLVLLIAVSIFFFSNVSIVGIRILANYFSLFIITYASYLALSYLGGVPYKLFRYCVYIWFIVGLIQYTIYPTFMSGLTLRGEVGSMQFGRGACSLAVEPTYYAMICIFLMIINYLNFRCRSFYRQLSTLLIIQLLFSKSTTVFLFLGIVVVLYSLILLLRNKRGIVYLLGLIVLILSAKIVIDRTEFFPESRLTNVIKVLVNSPENFLLMDYSVNNRFMHAFFPLKGFVENFGLPHGIGVFNNYLVLESWDPFWGKLLPYDITKEFRIATAFSGPLFELGIFALPIFYILIKSLRILSLRGDNGLLCGMIIFAMMLNNMPFSQAILPFIFGNIIYLAKNTSPKALSDNYEDRIHNLRAV